MRSHVTVNIICTILIVLLTIVVYSCQNSPSPLESFYTSFKKKIDKSILSEFKNMEEDSLGKMYLLLTNNAVELLQADSKLNNLLESHGIQDEKRKSFIILRSFHRNLNNKEIQFAEQIEEVKRNKKEYEVYKEKQDKCEQEKLEVAKSNLDNWALGDTLDLTFPVYYSNQTRKAYVYDCPTAYKSDTSEYLNLTGVLTRKDTLDEYDGSLSWYFYLKVLSMSDSNTLILLRDVKIDDTICINLVSYGRIIDRSE